MNTSQVKKCNKKKMDKGINGFITRGKTRCLVIIWRMLSLTSNQMNANENKNDIPLTTQSTAQMRKPEITSAGVDVGSSPSCTPGQHRALQPRWQHAPLWGSCRQCVLRHLPGGSCPVVCGSRDWRQSTCPLIRETDRENVWYGSWNSVRPSDIMEKIYT